MWTAALLQDEPSSLSQPSHYKHEGHARVGHHPCHPFLSMRGHSQTGWTPLDWATTEGQEAWLGWGGVYRAKFWSVMIACALLRAPQWHLAGRCPGAATAWRLPLHWCQCAACFGIFESRECTARSQTCRAVQARTCGSCSSGCQAYRKHAWIAEACRIQRRQDHRRPVIRRCGQDSRPGPTGRTARVASSLDPSCSAFFLQVLCRGEFGCCWLPALGG